MQQMSPMLQARILQQGENNSLNQSNDAQKIDLTQKPDTVDLSTKKENKNKKSKLGKFLAIGAAIAAVVAAGVAIYKGKGAKLSDIDFNKGIALSKNGEKFTGKIKDKLAGGDKIIMEYVDGVLQKSTRSGKVNFEKVYETINNEKIVKKTVDGITSEFNLTKTQNKVKEAQSKLKSILSDKKLTSAQLQEQTDAIQFKSSNQKKEIESAINSKQKAEAEAKARLEAEAKALEAEKIAKQAEEIAKTNFIDLSNTEEKTMFKPLGLTLKNVYKKFPSENPEEEIAYFKKLKSISVDESSKLGNYQNTPYDMPFKFMVSTNEKMVKNGSALIVDEVPEMFKGIKETELQKAIDNLGGALDSKKINKFEIAGRKFTAEYKGSGVIGRVYKISDEQGRSVAIKYFNDPLLTGLQGAYAEIPIAREASKEGVIDVAKFYMANPCGRYDTLDNFSPNANVGGWQMVEFLEDSTPLKKDGKGIKFFDWLKSHGLTFGDYNSGTMKGDYVVDVGGVMHPNNMYSEYFIKEGSDTADELLRGYCKNETLDDIINVLSKK